MRRRPRRKKDRMTLSARDVAVQAGLTVPHVLIAANAGVLRHRASMTASGLKFSQDAAPFLAWVTQVADEVACGRREAESAWTLVKKLARRRGRFVPPRSPDARLERATPSASEAACEEVNLTPRGGPMTGTERKRVWRRDHPEQSREAERVRAQARRDGLWNVPAPYLGMPDPETTCRPCASEGSYRRYELSVRRMLQKMNWRRIGPGSMKMSCEERSAAFDSYFGSRIAEANAQLAVIGAEFGIELGVEIDGTETNAELMGNVVDSVFSEFFSESL